MPNGTMDMDTIKKRVQKLLALSTSPNENEAVSAAAKAEALLREYNLSMAEVRSIESDEIIELGIFKDGSPMNTQTWAWLLASVTSKVYFCDCYKNQSKLYFVGRPGNLETCNQMFGYFLATIEKAIVMQGIKGKKKQSDFRLGMAQGISLKLREVLAERQRQAANDEKSTALVVQEEAKVKDFLRKKGVVYKNIRASHSEAYHNGVSHGKQVGINRQVTGH